MSHRTRTAIALATIYVVWGSTYLGIRVLVETVPPLLGIAGRFLAAAVLLGTLVAFRRGRGGLSARPAELAGAALVGTLLLAVGIGLVAIAEERVDSGLAALVLASVPLWVVALLVAEGRRVGRRGALGVAIGLVGVAILVSPSGAEAPPAWAVLLLLVAAAGTAVGSVASSRVPQPPDPLLGAVVQMGVAGAVLLAAAVLHGEAGRLDPAVVSGRSLLAFLYLVVLGSVVAYSAFVWLLTHAPVATVSTYAYVNPVVAVLLGWVVLDERLTARVLVGALVVVGAVATIVRRPATARPLTADAGAVRSPP